MYNGRIEKHKSWICGGPGWPRERETHRKYHRARNLFWPIYIHIYIHIYACMYVFMYGGVRKPYGNMWLCLNCAKTMR